MGAAREIELDCAKVRRREDGFIHVVMADDVDLTLEDCKKIKEAVQELCHGPTPILSDIRRMRSSSMLQIRYAEDPEVIAFTRKLAVLVGSPVSRMLGNAVAAVTGPPYPIRLFTDEREATKWLLEGSGEES